jgi:hypothetical protein
MVRRQAAVGALVGGLFRGMLGRNLAGHGCDL